MSQSRPTALKSDELEIDASLSSGGQVRTKFKIKYHRTYWNEMNTQKLSEISRSIFPTKHFALLPTIATGWLSLSIRKEQRTSFRSECFEFHLLQRIKFDTQINLSPNALGDELLKLFNAVASCSLLLGINFNWVELDKHKQEQKSTSVMWGREWKWWILKAFHAIELLKERISLLAARMYR